MCKHAKTKWEETWIQQIEHQDLVNVSSLYKMKVCRKCGRVIESRFEQKSKLVLTDWGKRIYGKDADGVENNVKPVDILAGEKLTSKHFEDHITENSVFGKTSKGGDIQW